jgi:hypothetical protein
MDNTNNDQNPIKNLNEFIQKVDEMKKTGKNGLVVRPRLKHCHNEPCQY